MPSRWAKITSFWRVFFVKALFFTTLFVNCVNLTKFLAMQWILSLICKTRISMPFLMPSDMMAVFANISHKVYYKYHMDPWVAPKIPSRSPWAAGWYFWCYPLEWKKIIKKYISQFFVLAVSSQFYYMLIFCQKRAKFWRLPLIILPIYMTNFIARNFEANFLKFFFLFFWSKSGQKSTWLAKILAENSEI